MNKHLVILLFFVLTGCQSEKPDLKKLTQGYYQNKKLELQKERFELCQEEIKNEAKKSIDSLIDMWVNAELIDTIRFPSKPRKPLRPGPIIDLFDKFPIDTLLQTRDSI